MPNMERLTTALAGCLAFVALHAQPVSESAPDPAFVRKRVRNKEIGLRYGVQIGVGSGAPGQAMQYAAMDFAAYNYRNIGLRTGLNLFTSPLHDGQYASVPLQFSWRSGVRRMRPHRPTAVITTGPGIRTVIWRPPPSAGSFSKPSCRRFLRCSNCMRA